ncbi:tetratricopeptide repeat protein [Streptomyces bikiniensis]|uniref:tetratricopeptide repeat protein n=1 Tax=Streptomyces bikiniensis TaxID=1896 RepID=UPI0004BEF721|nr:tetratricopeptide repeat protein [Streptomyces bikiniensis]
MLDTPEAVVEALRENHERPHGTQRTVTAEELVEAAEVFDKPDTLVTALLELMTAYEFTGEQRKSPVVFARLLKLWDTAPESFSPWEAHQVFWRFKWVTTSLLQVPEVPLDTVRGWIDRMRERYEEAGHGMQPVAAMRHHVAAHLGTGVEDAYDLWVTRPRTELSDCEACETRHRAWHRVAAGDDAAALDVWRPVLAGEQSCSEEPQTSQARALLPLLRLGRTDEARSHHLTGYRRVRGSTGMQHEVGLHLEFCALSRNEGRGLEVLAENRPLFEATGAPLDRLGFLTGVEVLLARLVEDGHGETPVAGPPGRNWTAGELLGHVGAEADRLAAAFDARNGTTAVGDRRRERLARRPLLDEPLPLGLRTAAAPRTPANATPAAPAAAGPGTPGAPGDFVALVAEARRLNHLGHPGDSRLWTRIAERLADGSAAHDDRLGPEELLRAELAEERAYRLRQKDEDAEGGAELETAAGLYEELGMEWRALAARARALAWTTGEGDADAGRDEAVRVRLDRLVREAEHLMDEAPLTGEKPGDGEAAAGVDVAADRVVAYFTVLYADAYAAYREAMRRDPEESGSAPERFREAVGRLRAEAERLGVPHQVANARQFVADEAGRRGDVALAESELRAALVDIEASERPWRGSRPRALLAQVMLSRQEPAEAAELLHRAIADAVRYDDEDFPLAPTYSLLGHASSHLGDHAGAVRHLSEAAARFDREGEHGEAADVRMQLAGVLTEAGRQADAVAVLESLLSEESAAALDERMVAQIRLSLARGLRELEEYLPSAEEFLRLAGTVSGWEEDDAPIRTLVTADTAVALALADRWEAAEAAYERALAAHAEAPNPPMIVRMAREFARLTTEVRGDEGVEAALAHLVRADGVLDAVPADVEGFAVWYERGEVHYRRARVLAEAERFEEALAEAEAAIGVHEEGGEHGELPRAEAVRFAALVEGNGLGRTDEAIARLTTAAARCRNAGRPEAAQILTALREEYVARPRG